MTAFVKNIPNILTIIRIAAAPVFIILMNIDYTYAAICFLIAEFTDVLDGIIARKFNMITPFGKIADPFADKLIQLTALFMLAGKGMIMPLFAYLVLFKELFMLIPGLFLLKKNVDMSSRWFGKLSSVLFFIAIMLAFFEVGRTVVDAVLWAGVGMALFSAVMYARNSIRQIYGKGKETEKQ
jgi:cardiolipin synthase